VKTVQEISEYRNNLRQQIEREPVEAKKEIMREEVFALDNTLGLFDNGKLKSQIEIFSLLQTAQTGTLPDPESPADHVECRKLASMRIYRWVLSH
jgi:hypothetical protein